MTRVIFTAIITLALVGLVADLVIATLKI